MNKSDRELLELAANAAGIEYIHGYFNDVLGLCISVGADEDQERWNPLTDDADALRLAVKLKMRVTVIGRGMAEAKTDAGKAWFEHESSESYDTGVATRRAIVRAAAEVARRENL